MKNRVDRAKGSHHLMTLPVTICLLVWGCGAVGPPIPPEKVGIEAKALQQRENVLKEGKEGSGELEPTEEEKVQLPSFYPIGTR